MKAYILAGLIRNSLGIALLTYLTSNEYSITAALFMVTSLGFSLYALQVRFFIGRVHFIKMAKMFAGIFISNRILLWIINEKLGMEIYISQFASIALITINSYLLLKKSISLKS